MKRNLHFIGIAALTFFEKSQASNIKCPKLVCKDQDHNKQNIKADLCYEHDINQPSKELNMYTCEWYQTWGKTTMTGQVSCEFDLASEKWAWISEDKQHWGGAGVNMDLATVPDSELNQKRTNAYCREIGDYMNNLNNGRTCTAPWECVFQTCEKGLCTGLIATDFCNSHSDCNAQMFCQKGTVWPWTYRCAKLRTSYEQCQSTFECSVAHYCWYASEADRQGDSTNPPIRKCLPLYSQDHGTYFGWNSSDWNKPTFEDYQLNGQYCKTGIAFPDSEFKARCTSTDHIKFNNERTKSPYSCNPEDNTKKCQLFFNITDYKAGQDAKQTFFEVPCRCALNGENPDTGTDGGYCGSILGTPEYKIALGAIKPVLEKSSCHTLDRYDFRAQRDVCGIGQTKTWNEAVSERFRINYWPYVNGGEFVKDCIEATFVDSLVNLSKSFAQNAQAAISGLVLGSMVLGQVLF